MKIKTGTLLVIGSLVLLIGMTVMLTPTSQPPPKDEQDHAAEAAEEPKDEKAEEPQVTLPQLKQMIAQEDSHGHQAGFEELQKLLVTTRDVNAKQEIINYVMTLGRTDPRAPVRAAAVATLQGQDLNDPEPLLAIARTDRDPEVRKAAILALSKFPPGGEVEQALRQFSQDADPGIRVQAVISLTQMMAAAGQAGTEQLVRLLGETDNDASAKASMNLHRHGAPALPLLINTLYKGQTGPHRHAAAMTIGLICAGYSAPIEAFAKQAQVTHRQEMGRREANLQGLQPLVWALENDPYAPTREIAAQGLGYLGTEQAAAPLAAALKDSDHYVRRRAAAALITTPAASVVPQLAEAATTDQVAQVRRFAVEALGWVGTPDVVPALNRATSDKSPMVRRYAAVQLGRLALPKGKEQVALSPDVQASIVEALSQLLGDKADPDPDVRWAAVVALGKLHDKAAQQVLVKSLSDGSPQVANSAERALQRLGIARHESEGFEG